MVVKPRVFALVPARAGSKGLPKKNLAELSGVSLVERALGIALKTKSISNVFVSSDSEEILLIASRLGAKVRRRPEVFANDTATATQVVQDFLDYLMFSEGGYNREDFILYLQPTSPLRTSAILEEAIALISKGSKSIVSVSELNHHPFKAVKISSTGLAIPIFDAESLSANRQDFPKAYYCDGNLFLFNIGLFLDAGSFPIVGSDVVRTPSGRGFDVDTAMDLTIIESLAKIGHLKIE